MSFKKVWLFFLLFSSGVCLGQFASSQYITNKRFLSVEDGLASREVFCGLQDTKGFIWLGTRNGLNRYDGESFVLFSKKTGLRSNTVVQLVQPDSNELWIFYGVSVFSNVAGSMVDVMNTKTNETVPLLKKFPNCPVVENEIKGMKSLGNGSFVLLTSKGYFNYTPSTHSFKSLYNKNALAEYYLFNNNFFYHNNAWINSLDEKIYYYADGKQNSVFENKNKLRLIIGLRNNGNAIATEVRASTNRFYEIHTNGEETIDTTIKNLSNKQLTTLGGTYWIHFDAATNSSVMNTYGLYCFENNSLYELIDSVSKSKLSNFTLYDYFVDQQNRKWICTSTGVFVFSRKPNYFQSLFNDSSSTAFNEKFNQARSIYADENSNVFASIGASICKSNLNGKITQFLPANFFKDNSNHDYLVYALTKDKKLYAGLTNDLLILEPDFSKATYLKTTLEQIWTLCKLDSVRLMGGCTMGYFIYDENKNEIVLTEKFPKMSLYSIKHDNENKLWGAGASGLFEFDDSGKIKTHFFTEAKNKKDSIPFTDLLDLNIDKEGIFWIATNGDGLYRWDRSKNVFEHFTRDDGLSSNLIYGILEDDFGNLWLSSDFGLNRFNKTTHISTIYTTTDGLNSNEFNRTSFFKADDGKLFFGGLNGVNAFHPKDFLADSSAFNIPFQLISCNVFDGRENKLSDRTNELLNTNEIILQPGDAFFTLQFQLLDYEQGKHHYAYRIDGIDKDWNYVNENSIRISGLNYGKYTLQIKAQNPLGFWSNDHIIISVNVIEPLMHRTWFRLLMMFALLVLIYIFVRYRTYRLSKDKEDLERTVELRTGQMRELLKDKDLLMKEIHHRVKNNLQVIGNLLEMQGENMPDEKLQRSFSEAQARVRSVAIIHHNLYRQDDLSSIEWKGFVDELAKSVASIFQPKEKHIEIRNSIPETFLDIDTAIPLGLILNELFTNSYKYAFANSTSGVITIELEAIDEGIFNLIYSDSGPGLKQDFNFQTTTSLGLRLIHRLASQLMGEVKYTNEGASKFTIQFKNAEARKMEE